MKNQYCKLSWSQSNIALITLNRPEKLNAINVEMLQEWREVLLHLQEVNRPKCLLITGSGRAFSAGADIKATIDVAKSHKGDLGYILSAYYEPVIALLRSMPCPVISVVNGLAVGVGFSFALHGDIIISSDDAYFWANFSEIGLAVDGGMSYLLPRAVGYHKAMAMTLLAEKIQPNQAKDWGIVYEVVPRSQLMASAIALADKLVNRSSVANQEIKMLHQQSFDNDFIHQMQAECKSQTKAGFSSEARDAIMAFLKK